MFTHHERNYPSEKYKLKFPPMTDMLELFDTMGDEWILPEEFMMYSGEGWKETAYRWLDEYAQFVRTATEQNDLVKENPKRISADVISLLTANLFNKVTRNMGVDEETIQGSVERATEVLFPEELRSADFEIPSREDIEICKSFAVHLALEIGIPQGVANL